MFISITIEKKSYNNYNFKNDISKFSIAIKMIHDIFSPKDFFYNFFLYQQINHKISSRCSRVILQSKKKNLRTLLISLLFG